MLFLLLMWKVHCILVFSDFICHWNWRIKFEIIFIQIDYTELTKYPMDIKCMVAHLVICFPFGTKTDVYIIRTITLRTIKSQIIDRRTVEYIFWPGQNIRHYFCIINKVTMKNIRCQIELIYECNTNVFFFVWHSLEQKQSKIK